MVTIPLHGGLPCPADLVWLLAALPWLVPALRWALERGKRLLSHILTQK